MDEAIIKTFVTIDNLALADDKAPLAVPAGSLRAPVTEHGGECALTARLYPRAPTPWLDLSTGINPHGYPTGNIPEHAFTRLPESVDFAALEAAAAAAYGAVTAEMVIAAPGAQALIQLLPRIIAGTKVGVLSPTYGEHAAVWQAAGRQVVIADTIDMLAGCDIAVLVNPNNPDGRIVPSDRLRMLARQTRLIVDESFADFSPEISFAPCAAEMGAVVLRSFGKTYGLAGVRLGFAILPPDIRARLAQVLGPWAVSGPAIVLGQRALADQPWLTTMAERLRADCRRLDSLLERAGFRILGGTELFRYAESGAASVWVRRLGEAGIHVRAFREKPHHLRFGLPPDHGWVRLETVLR